MVVQKELALPEFPRGFHLITHLVKGAIGDLPKTGLLNVFIRHTSAGLTINENADPTVRQDFESSFNHLVKEGEHFYRHTMEGLDDMPAHIKSTLVGSSVTIPIKDGRLALGTWQGIYFCEFRNRGGGRNLLLTIYS